MRVNVVLLIIAFGIAALAAFGFYAGNGDETYRWVITIGSGVGLFVTLEGIFVLSAANGGSANIKVVSVLFFIAMLIENLVFSFTAVRLAPYVIVTGILLLLYALIVYGIYRALK
jgi:hypothetical protein